MKTYVISVGGSAIVPDKIDIGFLKQFKNTILKLSKSNKLVIVCGGGRTAREYISAAKQFSVSDAMSCLAGIQSTKLNANTMIEDHGPLNENSKKLAEKIKFGVMER